jgi:hypothetical protein
MNCCGSPRKQKFTFENGTVVYASSRESAIFKLKNTDERYFSIQEIEPYTWHMQFSDDIFIEFESPSEHRARMQGPWLLIQDRRVSKTCCRR